MFFKIFGIAVPRCADDVPSRAPVASGASAASSTRSGHDASCHTIQLKIKKIESGSVLALLKTIKINSKTIPVFPRFCCDFGCKMHPRCAKRSPRGAKRGIRWAKIAFKMDRARATMVPRWHQDGQEKWKMSEERGNIGKHERKMTLVYCKSAKKDWAGQSIRWMANNCDLICWNSGVLYLSFRIYFFQSCLHFVSICRQLKFNALALVDVLSVPLLNQVYGFGLL